MENVLPHSILMMFIWRLRNLPNIFGCYILIMCSHGPNLQSLSHQQEFKIAFDFNPCIFIQSYAWIISNYNFLLRFTEKTNNFFRKIFLNKYFSEWACVCVYLMFEVLAQYLLIILVGTNFGQNIEPLEVSTRVTNSVRPKQKPS